MRILIVDDDPDTRTLVAHALAQELSDTETREIADVASLDAILAEAAPDILVTDYALRWSDGFQVFERVQAAHPGCVAIMFTGTGNEELAVRAMKRGFDDYLVKKPGQYKRLATSTRIAWERARKHRELEENRDLVLKELYHRLHNNLQIVLSLLSLTARALSNAADRSQIIDLGRRIQALSSLQEQFYRSPDFRRVDFTAYLDRLLRKLLAPGAGRIVLDVKLEHTEVPVDKAVPLGLVANEMIMNAVKHAFPDERTGTLSVELRCAKNQVTLLVADDGVGFQEGMASAAPGLGMQLVQRLADQVGADVAFRAKNVGTECRITLKL